MAACLLSIMFGWFTTSKALTFCSLEGIPSLLVTRAGGKKVWNLSGLSPSTAAVVSDDGVGGRGSSSTPIQ